jgi:2-polyprenyl-3-methyl-5-hydroxy-6-metoxy-1,4-benzoquinol methylase
MPFAVQEKTPHEPARPLVTWDEVPCPLCAGRFGTTLIEAQDHLGGADGLWFAVVQCDSCGTCFTNPRPDPASIGQFYAGAYAPFEKQHRASRRGRFNPLRLLKRPRVEKRPIPWHGRGRLLDFGCGSGGYLQTMQRQGWQVAGLDASPRMVERIRGELGLRAHLGSLPHAELEPESFDVITMWHALEHVHEPALILREARKLLVPGGKVVISAPNIDSLPFRWFGRHWFGLELPRHLTHFTPGSLLEMLQRAGFATEPIRHVRHADWLCTTARRACSARTNAPLWMRLLRYPIPARAVTWYNYWTDQCDCILAVGHR